MEKNLTIKTEETSVTYSNPKTKVVKTAKKTLTLPLITNISNSINRENSQNKINRNQKSQLRVLKNKKRMATARSPILKKYKINKDLDIVYKLNMEIDVDHLFEEDLKLKKQKEKIDNNPDILAKRLNIYKNNTEKNGEKKMEVDSKEKEKYIEKEFKDELEQLESIKKECNEINVEIIKIRDIIDEFKLEKSVAEKYGNLLDQKFMQEMKEKEKEKNKADKYANNNAIIEQSEENLENEEESNTNNNINNINNGNENELSKKNTKQEKFQQMTTFSQMKKKREERLKYINENLILKEEELKNLEEKQINLIDQCKKKKNGIYKLRHQLLNIYHLNLYEGLNFRSDGLSTLIRSIWNLGVNVDVNYMPTYLDNYSVDYLFDKTKRLIEVSKMRQIIEENEKELEESIKIWKQEKINENSKDSDNGTNSNFFQTGVMEKYNYMDKYPRSKQFMEDYNKKYFSKKDKFQINLKQKNEFKSKNIPYGIIEKYNNIEKLKYLLNNLIEQNDNKEKKEIERLSKEFINNNYAEKYNVAVETIMGAICGEEKKNEGILIYTKIQREYKEGKKLIQFHKNINKIK